MSWKIFQRLFNAPPTNITDFITDHNNQKFWISWEGDSDFGIRVGICYRGKWVGMIESVWDDEGGLDLGDIIIFENYCHLRHRGIGKKMLSYFIEKAKGLNAKFIWGFIQPHEGSTKEYLIEWYKRQGFEVNEGQPGYFGITMKLDSQHE